MSSDSDCHEYCVIQRWLADDGPIGYGTVPTLAGPGAVTTACVHAKQVTMRPVGGASTGENNALLHMVFICAVRGEEEPVMLGLYPEAAERIGRMLVKQAKRAKVERAQIATLLAEESEGGE